MDERKFNVVFKGAIHEQATLSLVQERLATIFKVDIEKIKIMFSKKRTIVKKKAPWEQCLKVEQSFLNSGAFVDIEEVLPEGYEPAVMEQVPPPEHEPETVQPNPPPGYEPEIVESGPPPGYESQPEPEPEHAPKVASSSPPEPEIVNPDPKLEEKSAPEPDITEPVMPESVVQPPLTMANKPEEIVPEPEEYEDEPSLGYAPIPDMEVIPEDELTSEDVPESESVPGSAHEFEIVEEDTDDALYEEGDTTEFEIVGLEPVIEPETEVEYDPEYEFDDQDEFVPIEDDSKSFEMENNELLPKASPENPYAAPRANLTQGNEDLSSKSNFVAPQKLPLKNGLNWLIGGFYFFKQNPVTWIASVFVFFLLTMIVSFIPILGAIASNLFNPVFLAGFMLGAKEQFEGGNYRIGHVFAGFSNNTGQLVLFGFLYFIVSMAIFGLMAIIGVGVFFFMTSGSMNFSDPALFSAFANISPLIILLIILVTMLISFPIMMAYYFGPALISINQASVFYAAKMSFRACLSNVLPFLYYSLACLGVFVAIGIIIGGLAVLAGMIFDGVGIFVGIGGMFIVMVAFMPVFFASTYVAYKDIFYIK